MQNSSSETIDQFLKDLENQGKLPSTILTYRQELTKYQDWLKNYQTELKNLSEEDVQRYISFLTQQGKSPKTIDKVFGVIRTFSKYIKRFDITLNVKIDSFDKTGEIDALSSNECENLLFQITNDGNKRNIAIAYILLHTGIRVSELCSLNVSDVNLNRNKIKITSNDQERYIPLSEEACFYLKQYIDSSSPVDALFISKYQERLTERSIQYILQKYNVSPKKLRHTFCKQLVNQGVSLNVISELVGHRDINVTKKYLTTKVTEIDFNEAIDKTF